MMLANKTLFLALFSLSKIPMHSLPRLSCFEFAYAFVSSSNILFIMSWSKLLHCYPARTNTAQWHREKKNLNRLQSRFYSKIHAPLQRQSYSTKDIHYRTVAHYRITVPFVWKKASILIQLFVQQVPVTFMNKESKVKLDKVFPRQ